MKILLTIIMAALITFEANLYVPEVEPVEEVTSSQASIYDKYVDYEALEEILNIDTSCPRPKTAEEYEEIISDAFENQGFNVDFVRKQLGW